MSAKKALSVGQCNYDNGNITQTLSSTFGVVVERAATAQEALAKLRSETFALVLVNRIFDLDEGSGLDLIREVKATPETSNQPIMLVSNFPEAQAEAVAAAVLPGFGKAALTQAETLQRLKECLGK